MKSRFVRQGFVWVVGLLLAQTLSAAEVEPGFRSLFNGKDLTGWRGNPALWSVKDGAITGVTKEDPKLTHNTFLVWTDGTTEDFELRLSYRMVGGNSGIQYRSKEIEQGAFGPIVGGYQADFEAGKTYSGILYEERGRGILALRGEKVVLKADPADPKKFKKEVVGSLGKSEDIQAKIKNEDWNDYVIIAQGNHLQHFINGMQTVDVIDEHEAGAAKSGVLALQIHVGPPMTVQFKDIRIKSLSGGAAGSDLPKLQGQWQAESLTRDGEVVPKSVLAGLRVRIEGNRFFIVGDADTSEGTFELLEGTSPKGMNVTTASGDTAPAIYELSGDTLKVCYTIDGGSRPTEFKSAAYSGRVLAVYRKAGADPLARLQGKWTPTRMVRNGESVPAADLANMKLTIDQDRFSFEADESAEGTFKVDASASPGKLDAVTSDGQPVPGIFEIGDGTFTICYSIQGGPRPKEFKAESYSDTVLVVFRKATP